MRIALVVEYDGFNYHGFQYQKNVVTIQEEIEKAIKQFTKETLRVRAAGRTDSGVHATGQVIVFDTERNYGSCTIVNAMNAYLPCDIAVIEAHRVNGDFDPRRNALSRTYVYSVLNGDLRRPLSRKYTGLVKGSLDVDKMKKGAIEFLGEHDFRSFTAPILENEGSTVRKIYNSEFYSSCGILKYVVTGSSFLTHQVRRMTGALVSVGKGQISLDQLSKMIEGQGSSIAQTMPPEGLCLVRVEYEDFPENI
jgi:tRNA pseudouridine38-40 synthase